MAKGKLIVIEGTDGSGKATQAKILMEHLAKDGFTVEFADFPQYNQQSCYFVDKYLRGDFGAPDEVGAYRASIFYALDRYDKSSELRSWLNEGRIIICNRYTTSNKGHQAGKITDAMERERYLNWLDELEYGILGIPREDLVILLHAPFQIGQRMVANRTLRSNLGSETRDVHEKDADHLRNAEAAYLHIAKKDGWHVVSCSADNMNLLPIQEIHDKVYGIVIKNLRDS